MVEAHYQHVAHYEDKTDVVMKTDAARASVDVQLEMSTDAAACEWHMNSSRAAHGLISSGLSTQHELHMVHREVQL